MSADPAAVPVPPPDPRLDQVIQLVADALVDLHDLSHFPAAAERDACTMSLTDGIALLRALGRPVDPPRCPKCGVGNPSDEHDEFFCEPPMPAPVQGTPEGDAATPEVRRLLLVSNRGRQSGQVTIGESRLPLNAVLSYILQDDDTREALLGFQSLGIFGPEEAEFVLHLVRLIRTYAGDVEGDPDEVRYPHWFDYEPRPPAAGSTPPAVVDRLTTCQACGQRDHHGPCLGIFPGLAVPPPGDAATDEEALVKVLTKAWRNAANDHEDQPARFRLMARAVTDAGWVGPATFDACMRDQRLTALLAAVGEPTDEEDGAAPVPSPEEPTEGDDDEPPIFVAMDGSRWTTTSTVRVPSGEDRYLPDDEWMRQATDLGMSVVMCGPPWPMVPRRILTPAGPAAGARPTDEEDDQSESMKP